MKSWKRMLAAVLGSTMILSQGMPAFAEETEPEAEFGAELGAGEDMIVSEKSVPQQGAGIGLNIPGTGTVKKEGLTGSAAMGSAMDMGNFAPQMGASWGSDEDTIILDDIQLELHISGSYTLKDAEDSGFYYIDTWGEHGIPNMMVGFLGNGDISGFFDQYTSYMKESRPDLTVAEGPADVTLGDKNLQEIVYNYGIQGYTIRDTRYVWRAQNDGVYMFTKREIPELDYMLGNQLEDIVTSAALMGSHFQGPQDETIVSVPQTTAPAPQPGTTAPAPQPETTAPAPQNGLYVKNDDSSWTVTTDYYTMTIPPAWTGHFDASVRKQYNTGYNLQVVSKENADAGFGGNLFTIMLIPQSEDYTVFPSYDYLGTMSTPEGILSVIILYPTDVQSGDVWTEFYKILYGDKNTAISSMRPKAGIVWTLPDGKTISGDASQGGTAAPQPETTAPAPQPETTVNAPSAGGNVLGTTSADCYTNDLFRFTFNAPAGWIFASQEQLAELNEGITQDQAISSIESGSPVCVVYAQSADGLEVMNIIVENGASFLDPSIQSLTQEDMRTIFSECIGYSTSSLESLGAAVTGASVNTVNFMGQTCFSLDISFNYAGMSGIQKQIGIPMGTYIALVTVRSVSGDNTQAMLDMFSAI